MKPTTKLPLRNNGSTLIEPCAYGLGMGHGFRLRLAIDKVGIIHNPDSVHFAIIT